MVAISSYISNLTRHSAAMDVLGKRMGSGRVAATLPRHRELPRLWVDNGTPPDPSNCGQKGGRGSKTKSRGRPRNLSALRLSPKTSDPNFCSTYCKHW